MTQRFSEWWELAICVLIWPANSISPLADITGFMRWCITMRMSAAWFYSCPKSFFTQRCPLWCPGTSVLSYELDMECCGVLKQLGSHPGTCYSSMCLAECSRWWPIAANCCSHMLRGVMIGCNVLASGGYDFMVKLNWSMKQEEIA